MTFCSFCSADWNYEIQPSTFKSHLNRSFLAKVAKVCGDFWATSKTITLKEKTAIFWTTIKSNIWSHWLQRSNQQIHSTFCTQLSSNIIHTFKATNASGEMEIDQVMMEASQTITFVISYQFILNSGCGSEIKYTFFF